MTKSHKTLEEQINIDLLTPIQYSSIIRAMEQHAIEFGEYAFTVVHNSNIRPLYKRFNTSCECQSNEDCPPGHKCIKEGKHNGKCVPHTPIV